MKEDYKKCYKKLRKDTLPKPLEELENDIISDSPDENFYFLTKFLYIHMSKNMHDVSDTDITAVCVKFAEYEWWAKCIKEIEYDSNNPEIEQKQNLADRIISVFDYYHTEILPKQFLQKLTNAPPGNMPRSDLLSPDNTIAPHSQQSHNPEHQNSSKKFKLTLPDGLNNRHVSSCLRKAVLKGYIKPLADNKLEWLGDNGKKSSARLAYFCGLIFGYKRDSNVNGNAGGRVPYTALEDLFGVRRLDRSLRQVHEALKPQPWRIHYDNLVK